MELLAVLALFSILMGIGVGAFRKINLGRQLAVAQVKDALRAARLFAIEQSAHARVDVDPQENRIFATGFTAVGNWHFEELNGKGWPTDADARDGAAVLIPDGAIGSAFFFPEGEAGWVPLGRTAAFDAERGVRIEAFVRVDRAAEVTVVRKGRAYLLGLTEDLGVVGSVRTRERGEAGKGDGEEVRAEAPHCVVPDRWTRIAMSFDGRQLRIEVDGRERAVRTLEERAQLWPDPDSDLVVGSTQPAFVGAIDEVKLAVATTNEAPPLPNGVRFKAAASIDFTGDGRLDPAVHSAPVPIELLYEEDKRSRKITVSLSGEVQ